MPGSVRLGLLVRAHAVRPPRSSDPPAVRSPDRRRAGGDAPGLATTAHRPNCSGPLPQDARTPRLRWFRTLVYAGDVVLTLSRKPGQKIFIGGGIEIEVREIRGAQVRLGITAPKGLPVYREELYLQIADANRRSMTDLAVDRLMKLEKG